MWSVNLCHHSIRQGVFMRYWLTDYELARPRIENCGKAYLISSIIMANILKYITGGDNILKRQTAGKIIFQNIYEKRYADVTGDT